MACCNMPCWVAPCRTTRQLTDHMSGKYTVVYQPVHEGVYRMSITLGGDHIIVRRSGLAIV